MHSILALATILVLFLASAFAAQLSIFVATDGSDYNGDGSIGRPLSTWYGAAGYIMDLQNKSAYTDIFVEFRGGKYYLDNTIYFTASASGSPSLRIHYRGYQNEAVEFIGGQSLGGWSKAISPAVWSRLKHHARSHIIVASVDPSLVGTLQPRGMSAWGQGPPMELFFQGKAMQLARYPNEDFLTLDTVNSTDQGFTFKDSSNIANWQQETDPWAHGYWGNDWADDYVPIKPLTVANGAVSSGALSDLSMGIQAGQRFYLYNFLSELDSPGEYYIDRTNNLIYFWPPSEDYTTEDFVVSTLDSNLLNMDDVAYVSFSNFTIEAARYTGIYGHNMHHVNFTRLTIRNVGTEAMVVDGPSNIVIEDCHIYGTGTYGIILEGGYRNNLTRSNHVIRYNKIHDWTRVVRTYRPAISIDGVGITVEYNELFDAPHNALMWKGNYHTIQHNVVHDVCYETGDVGAFYSGSDWTRRGNVIRHNLFYNIDGPGFLGASAIYLDDQYSSVEIYDNIFYNIFQVLVLGGGRDNNFTNNLIINSKNGIYMDARGLGQCGPQSDWELRDNLAKVPYTQPPWSTAFPKLATILNGNPHEPTGNTMGYNMFVNGAWKNFCPDAQVTPYVDMKENCFALAMSDFSNPIHLNFTIINNALSKCTATFTSKYHTIFSSGFGIRGTFAI